MAFGGLLKCFLNCDMIVRQTNRQADMQKYRQTDAQIVRETDGNIGTEMKHIHKRRKELLTDTQIERQKDGQRDEKRY